MFETEGGHVRPSKAVVEFLGFRETLDEQLGSGGLVLGPEDRHSYTSRFIIATNGNVDGAVKQIREHQGWLVKHALETVHRWPGRRVLGNKCDALEIDQQYPLYIRGKDRFGHPVVYAKAGRINVKNILKLVSADEFILYHSWLRERMMRMRDLTVNEEKGSFSAKRYSPSDAQYTVVLDFEGGSMSQVGPTFYSIMQRTTQIDQTYYPERMFRSILVHTPFIFTAVWRMVKGFLDKDTVSKLRITRSDHFKYLSEMIDPDQIPQEYGGSAPPLDQEDHISQVTERFFSNYYDNLARIEEERKKAQEISSPVSPVSPASSPPRSEDDVDHDDKISTANVVASAALAATLATGLVGTVACEENLAPKLPSELLSPSTPQPSTTEDHSLQAFENEGNTIQAGEDEVEPERAVHAFQPPKIPNAIPNRPIASVLELQAALLRAHLDFEQIERETLLENEYLRRRVEQLGKEAMKERQTRLSSSFSSSQQSSSSRSVFVNIEIEDLEQQIDRLRHELEEILEETSAHQRAISFARNFIENEAAASHTDQEYLKLKNEVEILEFENTLFAEHLDKAFGEGAASLILRRRVS